MLINALKRRKHVLAKHHGPPDSSMTWLYLPKKSLNSLAAWSQKGRGWLCFHLHRNLSSLNILTVSNARKHMRDREDKKVSLWQTWGRVQGFVSLIVWYSAFHVQRDTRKCALVEDYRRTRASKRLYFIITTAPFTKKKVLVGLSGQCDWLNPERRSSQVWFC